MMNQAPTASSPAPATTRLPGVGAQSTTRTHVSAAATLIGIGVGALVLRATGPTPGVGTFVVLALGLAFVAAHVVTRQYGPLVPGGILTGLGAGIVTVQHLAVTDEPAAGIVILGLGLGFLSIWVIGGLLRVAGHHWWPIVPGGILAVIGGSLAIDGQAVQVVDYWPLVLVGIGVLVLLRSRVVIDGHGADAEGRRS
jgi:hypothetical protein